MNVIKCPPNSFHQVKAVLTLTLTLPLLLEIGYKCLKVNGHFVLDIKLKLGVHLITCKPGHKDEAGRKGGEEMK